MKKSSTSQARRSGSSNGEIDRPSPPQSVRRETLLAFLWANRGDVDSTVGALTEGSLVLTGNFKGLELEIARQATNHANGGTTR